MFAGFAGAFIESRRERSLRVDKFKSPEPEH
jgi:hypothetical protein